MYLFIWFFLLKVINRLRNESKATLTGGDSPHTGPKKKRYCCEECNKCFRVPALLRAHQRTHTGERLYSCDQCHKSFTQYGNLNAHLRTHTGEKPYLCDQCGKRFTLSGDLKKHMCIHTGERPFQCDQCGKSFKQNHHLKKHQKTHTEDRSNLNPVSVESTADTTEVEPEPAPTAEDLVIIIIQ